MKPILLTCLLFSFLGANSQQPEAYLEKIRDNPAKLTAFFQQMPKGGDLHHHYSGSIYTETYIKYVVDRDCMINLKTLKVSNFVTNPDTTQWVRFSKLGKQLPDYKQKLMQKWSVKDYNGVSYPSDKQFFEAFSAFSPASSYNTDSGFLELKARAKSENVSYIETMFSSIRCKAAPPGSQNWNQVLWEKQGKREVSGTEATFETLFRHYSASNAVKDSAANFAKALEKLHRQLGIDDSGFTMRYLTYIRRTENNPTEVFKNLIVAFEAAKLSKLIVGVNIVAPEDDETSMKDYWLHMQMFRFCHRKFPEVKISTHAGELTLGLVKPEELTWHINAAVREASANRIGHGVDIAYENQAYDLLRYMKEQKVAVEINLVSNEFILKVKEKDHPITLYREFGVPMVISTDDAGILRTDLTEQYVLLALRYPEIKYPEIKDLVFNSLRYSFIEEPAVREQLTRDLERRFAAFEAKFK